MSDDLHPDDPRIGHPERTFTTETAYEAAEQIREDYREWAQRTGRPKPKTRRVDAPTAYQLVRDGLATPETMGWPDMESIERHLTDEEKQQ